MKIQVKKFKKIEDVTITLSPLNIFIGTNNSGKSSFIQGIQFAVSSCQTLKLKGAVWRNSRVQTLSLDSSEYLYTPTNNIQYLYHGKQLTGSRTKESRNWIEFVFTDGNDEATIKISRGKNGGFTTTLDGLILGNKINDILSPYCVYVPGIAGIPVQEKYEVPIAVKKSATRGDSNNYLRNILNTISKDHVKWTSFKDSINKIYPNTDVNAYFNENSSEYIEVFVKSEGLDLPLDSIGTGLLQVIQIFAYIEYFNPRIILLDEPDSHIHPTKQKALAEELFKRAQENPELKIVFSTHSRYILEALENKATVFHFQKGRAFPDIKGSKILLDIGAADADYLFSKRDLKYVIVTEDKVDNVEEKKSFIKKFILANGLTEDEFVLHSYEGCTKVEFARILQGFIRKQIPTVKVIVHIDRDQKIDSDRGLLKLREDCLKKGLLLFITRFQEIESYFCQPMHIHKTYGIPLDQANTKYKELVGELEEETKIRLANFILRERPELGRNPDNHTDIRIVNELVAGWYRMHAFEFTLGKELLGKVKKFAQEELRDEANKITNISEALISDEFQSLLHEEQPAA